MVGDFSGRLLGVVILALVSGLAHGATCSDDEPRKTWREGPVRYVLTPDEFKNYGEIATDAEREQFIADFWKKLDPDPGTEHNAFRDRFRELCTMANGLFAAPLGPGWQTDRGRVLILLGVPDAVERDAGGQHVGDREIWTYQREPPSTEHTRIVFHRSETGGFRLYRGEEIALLPEVPDPTSRGPERHDLHRRLQYDYGIRSPANREVLVDTLMPDPTLRDMYPPEWSGDPPGSARRSARNAPVPGENDLIPFDPGAYFFLADDGTVVALLALEIDGLDENGATQPYSAVAWVVDTASRDIPLSSPTRMLAPLVADEPRSRKGRLMMGGHVYLPPGDYDVAYAVRNADEGSLQVRSTRIVVPDLRNRKISASTVVPAESFGPVVGPGDSPFVVGSEHVVPRPGGVFHRGEPLRIYLQVYGAAIDAARGEPRVDVRFRFERSAGGGYRRHGKPVSLKGATGGSLGLALPIGEWPTGGYRVIVEIRDRTNGARASSRGFFTVAD